jgi:hypothetical protein
MISATVGSSPAERDEHFHGATLLSTRAYKEGAAFVVADEIPTDLFRRHLRSPIVRDALIYIANGAKQKAL